MITADTITDEQIRELEADVDKEARVCAAMALDEPGLLTFKEKYQARTRCAEILNARHKEP